MLSLRMQNPQVLQADIALVTASNQGIPVTLSNKELAMLSDT